MRSPFFLAEIRSMSSSSILVLLGWIVLTFLAPAAGFRARPGEWFRGLTKPAFNPPSWLFAPVWTALYILMAIAAWMVWRRGGWEEQALPLSLYLVQLILNAAWTPLFFGAHRIGLAFVEIVLQWCAIAATLISFSRVDRLAAWLFLPLLLWVTFALALNFEFWRKNR